jgi:hypothetical protein
MSFTPVHLSKDFMCNVTAGWVKNSFSEAALKLFSLATK